MKFTTIWTFPGLMLGERFSRTRELAWMTMAHYLPRRLAYWSYIDTSVRYVGNDVVPETPFAVILDRFGKDIDKH